MELDSSSVTNENSQSGGIRKNISLKLKTSSIAQAQSYQQQPSNTNNVQTSEDQDRIKYENFMNEETKVIDRQEATNRMPEPRHRGGKLNWDHSVNLLGQFVANPLIHCCEMCDAPILIYGRLIPCKHVFCLDCANKQTKHPSAICDRCGHQIERIEQCSFGTVYVCTHGGSRNGRSGCRRTYLSERDMQAHYEHRHVSNKTPISNASSVQQNYNTPNESSQQPQQMPVFSSTSNVFPMNNAYSVAGPGNLFQMRMVTPQPQFAQPQIQPFVSMISMSGPGPIQNPLQPQHSVPTSTIWSTQPGSTS